MTEDQWHACNDPQAMLDFIRGRASDRKLRLFACACCRQVPDVLSTTHGVAALDVAERLADCLATNAERRQSHEALAVAKPYIPSLTAMLKSKSRSAAIETARAVKVWQTRNKSSLSSDSQSSGDKAVCDEESRGVYPIQASLLKDIFGPHLFRAVTADPTWLTSTVLLLAQGIYEEHAFDRMPILADCLMDEGCDNEDILNHCRDEKQVHVRGCWVLDGLLGKS